MYISGLKNPAVKASGSLLSNILNSTPYFLLFTELPPISFKKAFVFKILFMVFEIDKNKEKRRKESKKSFKPSMIKGVKGLKPRHFTVQKEEVIFEKTDFKYPGSEVLSNNTDRRTKEITMEKSKKREINLILFIFPIQFFFNNS